MEITKEVIARKLIQAHLAWDNSRAWMPSKDRDNVRGWVIAKYASSVLPGENWDNAPDSIKDFTTDQAMKLYEEGAQLADMKWKAAMLLLDMGD